MNRAGVMAPSRPRVAEGRCGASALPCASSCFTVGFAEFYRHLRLGPPCSWPAAHFTATSLQGLTGPKARLIRPGLGEAGAMSHRQAAFPPCPASFATEAGAHQKLDGAWLHHVRDGLRKRELGKAERREDMKGVKDGVVFDQGNNSPCI